MPFQDEQVEGIVRDAAKQLIGESWCPADRLDYDTDFAETSKQVRSALRAYGELMDKEFEERSKDVHDDCVVTRGLEIARSMIRRSLEERK